jgi:hypothetical protein
VSLIKKTVDAENLKSDIIIKICGRQGIYGVEDRERNRNCIAKRSSKKATIGFVYRPTSGLTK